MRFSVIVPVYNVENYLKECVESILDQSYKDYEVILVDDGSTDKSGEICDYYAKLPVTIVIKCIHKKNGGLSDARNTGIANAEGDYLIFVDSDDWIDKDALKNLSAVLNNQKADVVVTRLAEAFDDKIVHKDASIHLIKRSPDNEIAKFIFEKSGNTWPAVRYIVKKKYIEQYGIHFKLGVLHEDLDWTAKLFLSKPTCVIMDNEWYYHRMGRNGSITNIVKAKNITDVIDMACFFYEELHTSSDCYRLMILNRIMESVYGTVNKYKYCSKKDKLIVEKKVRDNISIFSIHPKAKYTIFYIFLRLFGSKISLGLLSTL